MPGVFTSVMTRAVASGSPTVGTIVSATSVRPRITRVNVGARTTMSDTALQWILQRITATGTGTSVTPQATDPANASLNLHTAAQAHSSEPTYTSGAVLWQQSIHVRAPFVLYLDGDSAVILPATANNGVGVKCVHASATPDVDVTMEVKE